MAYLRVKQLLKQEKMQGRAWFCPWGIDRLVKSIFWLNFVICLVNRIDFHTSLILHMHLVGEYLPVSPNRTSQAQQESMELVARPLLNHSTDPEDFKSDDISRTFIILSFSHWIVDLAVIMLKEELFWAGFRFSCNLYHPSSPLCWQEHLTQPITNTPTTGCEPYGIIYLVFIRAVNISQNADLITATFATLPSTIDHRGQ